VGLPLLLVAPQLLLTAVFFLWPAGEAIWSSTQRQDAFGLRTEFVGFENFSDLFSDPLYLESAGRTVLFCVVVSMLAMGVALVLAVMSDAVVCGQSVAAVLWIIVLHPQIGLVGRWLNGHGVAWDYKLRDAQAFGMVVVASAWKQVSYDFIFYVAGLQAIPRSVVEAARIDGARGWRRFRTITLPLLMPTTFFLLVVNLVYAAFETFGTIAALTGGGPGKATETLVVKVYRDGVVNLDLGSSSAQSVILMVAVIVLTMVQFRFLSARSRD